MEKAMHLDQLTMGVCYYPEHWPEELWPQDINRMLQTGIKIIRIAEFAWSEFEPEEGKFGGGLFDRFMDVVASTEMKVIFCTPTATPPAWMSEKYPEILNATKEGVLLRHGLRKHYNYNSSLFRNKTELIVNHLGNRYGKHSSIIGWQLDNEFNWGIDEYYSESDQKQFRLYLKDKYGSIQKLNEVWGNVFWNQKYTDWEEIHLERPNVKNQPNPHMALDAKRFFSWSTIRYSKMQYDALRPHLPKGVFITSNGHFNHIDHNELVHESLDFLTHNSYPSFGFNHVLSPPETAPLLDRMASFGLTKVRGISPNFGIMEQQSGAGGWLSEHFQPAPKPGQMRLWTFQSIAHGADFISYFRWRTCTFGTEMYWHGILDCDNRENRRIKEAKSIHKDMEKIASIAGGRYEAKVGILYDYDNNWDGELDLWHGPLSKQSDRSWFVALQEMHVPFDYVNIRYDCENFSNYNLLIYPHATMIKQVDADHLDRFVRDGGILIAGARSGYKDENGHCRMIPQPGPLAEIFGISIDDWTYLSYLEQKSTAKWDGDTIEMSLFNDILNPLQAGCTVLANYTGDYYAGSPAITMNRHGMGKAYYFGAAFTVDAAKMILTKLGYSETYGNLITLPICCEVAVRKKENMQMMFILNYSAETVKLDIKKPLLNAFDDELICGEKELEPFGVLVLKEV